ncbi:hypothetical protein RD792_005159 [Penstemon davidsonii]|uniref:Cytochrome P450 n=1 Tax=Penstemon davidsonii TaxID=160366 RepID=A0ABR0DJJ6_9LAMI|nr:hypothetical protein RD792_005159 [Penstemon davidsonii]
MKALCIHIFPLGLLLRLGLLLLGIALYFFKIFWLNPWRIRRNLELQGIKGPKPSFLYGNALEMQKIQALSALKKSGTTSGNNGEFVAHDYTSTLFPYFEQWRKEYGKPSYITKRLAPMLGNGILRSNGHMWARQRKVVAPEFFMDKVKGMVGLMLESAESLTNKWERCIEESEGGKIAEIKAEEDLRSVTADVISKACFGSSYVEGKQIFSKLRTLQELITNQAFLFGSNAFRLVPNGQQRKIENLEKEIESLIWEAAKERDKECNNEENRDLLQLIMEGAINNNVDDEDSPKRFIVDNCKNIYFAGHESTAIAASWCLMLLALHPQWQARIRAELAQVFGPTGKLDPDSLHKLKTVTMVIQEVLRLYPPAAFVSREALQETQIGHIVVPKGVCLWTLIPTLHRDLNVWGPDVNEFNPERFANGISNACKVPQVYIPFGLGPRLCLGRNFALIQLKIVVAVIVSKFSFSLSPKYRHSPAYRMIVEPGKGVQLLIQRHAK